MQLYVYLVRAKGPHLQCREEQGDEGDQRGCTVAALGDDEEQLVRSRHTDQPAAVNTAKHSEDTITITCDMVHVRMSLSI